MSCLSNQRRGELQGKTMRHRKSAEKIKNKLGNGRTGAAGRISLEGTRLSPSAGDQSSPRQDQVTHQRLSLQATRQAWGGSRVAKAFPVLIFMIQWKGRG